MKAVILAGGLGNRLKPFTEIIPKPLLPIGEKSVLEIQIEHLKKCDFNEIYIATNYKSDYIEKFLGDGSRYGVKINISKEDEPLGTVGPLTLLKDKLTEPFLVINGDILTQMNYKELYDFALRMDTLLTISIKEFLMPFAFGNVFYKDDLVTGIEEKPLLRTKILAGVYIFKKDIFTLIPDKTYFNMDELIKKMLKNNIPIAKYEIKDYWLDIGQIDDYKKAQDFYEEHFK